jgi:DNA-binding winged helix-turn-helix (wHTH) protein
VRLLVVERAAEHLLWMLRQASAHATEKLVPIGQLASALMDTPDASELFVVAAEPTARSVLAGPPRAARPRRDATGARRRLTLDFDARVILGLKMAPLLSGEILLLKYLGARPGHWFSSIELARNVYQRTDASARQLVWKYASTLRRKLLFAGERSLRVCRKRGYSFSQQVISLQPRAKSSASSRRSNGL